MAPAAAQLPVPQGSPIPRIMPQAPPSVSPGLRENLPEGPGAAVPNVAVAVRSVIIEGATAYPAEQLNALASGLVGESVPLARIEAARQAILSRYRDDGFVLTAVTAARDSEGVLRFVITEGRIVDVKLDGDIGPAGTTVLRFLRQLIEHQPIDAATLERHLLLAQSVPGVTLRTVLRPSTDEPGAITLVAEVERKPFSGLLTADNASYPLTGPQQGLLVLDGNSFTEFGDRTEVSWYHTSGNTQNFGQASSEIFLGWSGLRMRIYGGAGPTIPSTPLRTIGYHGDTSIFGASLQYPVILRRAQTLNLSASLDAIDERIRTNAGIDGTSIITGADSIRVLRLGGDYALHDDLLGAGRGAVSGLNVRLSQGINALGASTGSGPSEARLGESLGFFKANMEISRTQTLLELWESTNVALAGLLGGQWTPDILPPVEKYYLGGLRYNPGYYSGELTGDKAITASAELQLNTSYEMQLFKRSFTTSAQFFLFYAWGEAWQNQRLDANGRLSSAGGGVRMNLSEYLEVDVLGVSRFVLTPVGSVQKLHSDAVYWRVVSRF